MSSLKKEVIPVRFEVDRILFRNSEDGYTILQATFKKYPAELYESMPNRFDTIVIGNFFSIQENDEFEGEGEWIENKKFGHQFKLNWCTMYNPVSKKGIKQFLQRFVKGIGAKAAESIVNYYEEDTLIKIREDWKNLLKVPGIGQKRAKAIHSRITEHDKFEKIAMFVLQNNGKYKDCITIYESLGDRAVEKIKENPYILCTISKIGFLTADKFALNLNYPFDSMDRIRAAILAYIDLAMKQYGDIFIFREELISNFQNFLNKRGAYQNPCVVEEDKINKALQILTKEYKIVIEIDENGKQCIYLSFYNNIEYSIVKKLKELVEEPKSPIAIRPQIEEFIKKYEKDLNFSFADKQKQAVYMAIENGFSILTGGPGTGKTQTINSIIKCIKSVNKKATIELCAPTGKAAKRMTELTGMEAKTIHRLIELNGYDDDIEEVIISPDFLVVDESSMIDVYVFYRLLKAIDENTRILLVGDYDQLPSVGPGLILRDLINSGKIPTTRLTEIFRQAKESQIVMNSHKIITGKKTTGEDCLEFDNSKNDFYFIEKTHQLEIQKYLIKSIENLMTNQNKKLSEIQVLTPVRKGELGVFELNRLIQQTYNPSHYSKAEIRINPTVVFRVGDKVIQTRNNYDLQVFNGEVGYIISIEKNGDDEKIVVDFEDKTIEYDQLTVEELLLAYAITIHKSQGSEFPVVIMPISPIHEMLNRNLVYTALTRAKDTVICIGSKRTLDKAVDKIDSTIRNSRIRYKLINYLNSEPKVS